MNTDADDMRASVIRAASVIWAATGARAAASVIRAATGARAAATVIRAATGARADPATWWKEFGWAFRRAVARSRVADQALVPAAGLMLVP